MSHHWHLTLSSHFTTSRTSHITHYSYLTCHITDISHYHPISPHHGHHTSLTSHLTTKVRELPRKMNIEEVEEPETTRITTKNPYATTAGTQKVRELPRDRRHPESTRITRKNEHPSTKVRKLPRILSATSDLNPALYYRKNPKC